MKRHNTVIRVRPGPGGRRRYIGEVEIPAGDEAVVASASGPDGAMALARAAAIADRIMNDPVMSALIPPQAHQAVAAAKLLAQAAHAGQGVLETLWKKLKGPGKKRLARVLIQTTSRDVGAVPKWAGRLVDLRPGGAGRGGRTQPSGARGAGFQVDNQGRTPRAGEGFRWNPNPPPGHWEREGSTSTSTTPPVVDPYTGQPLPPGWTLDPYTGVPVPPPGTQQPYGGGYGPYGGPSYGYPPGYGSPAYPPGYGPPGYLDPYTTGQYAFGVDTPQADLEAMFASAGQYGGNPYAQDPWAAYGYGDQGGYSYGPGY